MRGTLVGEGWQRGRLGWRARWYAYYGILKGVEGGQVNEKRLTDTDEVMLTKASQLRFASASITKGSSFMVGPI